MRILFLIFAAIVTAIQGAHAQTSLRPEQAEQLETGLKTKPDDLMARLRLLSYCNAPDTPAVKAIESRRRHILWIIEKYPDHAILGNPVGIIREKNDRLADAEGYSMAAKLWRDQIGRSTAKAETFRNAGEFFKWSDPAAALKIIEDASKRYPQNVLLGGSKGSMYAYALTGASTVANSERNTPAFAFTGNALSSEESRRLTKELEATGDVNVLVQFVSTFDLLYFPLHRQNAATAQALFKLAEDCMARANRIKPEDVPLQYATLNLYFRVANLAANAKEKARLLEKGAQFLTMPQARSRVLTSLAEAHFDNRQYDAAALDAEEALQIASENPKASSNYESQVHEANTILGRVALKREKPEEAKKRLMASGRVESTPLMSSLGPKLTLAQDLLEAGERETVMAYLVLCKNFWKGKDAVLDGWTETIRKGGTPEFRRRTAPARSLTGTVASAFRLKDLHGREHTLEEYKGKVVLLDFWATWCAPCRAEMPAFEKLHREFNRRDVVILAVDVGEEEDVVSQYIRKEKLTFPVLLTGSGDMPDKYNVSAYPTLVVVDRNGRISESLIGGRSESALRAAIGRGMATTAPRGDALTKAESAPAAGGAAPLLVSPPDGAVFHHFPRTTQLTWSPVKDAVAYVVEWDYKYDGKWWSEDHNSEVTKRVTGTMFTFDFAGGHPGRWRVYAVFAGGNTSAKSGWHEFSYSR